MNSKPAIAIIGAGPGGLTLARLLDVAGFNVTVFEKESHALARPQGGTLDLHADTGLAALEHAGLTDQFNALARYEDQGNRVLNMQGAVLFDQQGADRPEIDRTALRTMLLHSLPDGCVNWGRAQRKLMQHEDRWHLTTPGGKTASFDLVVGADGAFSCVRPLLSPYEPQYSGLTFVELGIDHADTEHPAVARLVGHGKMDVEGLGKAIIAQRNGNGHIRVYAIFRVPTDWLFRRFKFSDPDWVKRELVTEYNGYAEDILDLFRACNDTIAVRPIHALPVGHCWTNRPGLTLIGDAAHVMSPFGGEGVNHAMFDALELARLLTGQADWKEAVRLFESAMFARVAEPAKSAAEAAATFLSHDGEALTLEMVRSHVAENASDVLPT